MIQIFQARFEQIEQESALWEYFLPRRLLAAVRRESVKVNCSAARFRQLPDNTAPDRRKDISEAQYGFPRQAVQGQIVGEQFYDRVCTHVYRFGEPAVL